MRFGPVRLAEAEGAILAHSLRLPDGTLKKGRVLGAADLSRLSAAGIQSVIAARPDLDDVGEDVAAGRIAAALAPDPAKWGLELSAPFTGRANVFAATSGVFRLDPDLVDRINAIDEAVTLATLPDHARVTARQMLATVKIIPYAAPEAAVAEAERLLGRATAMQVHAPVRHSADLILTQTPGMKPQVLEKGAQAVRARLTALGISHVREQVVAHETAALADALAGANGTADISLILTASATSDRDDVGPAGLAAAGGTLQRFGMPVDPGNLLFLGQLDGRPVVGLPGCARSPKLNGADWVLERLVCGLEVTGQDVARMGVGGLLKEISARPEPRAGGATAPQRPRVAALLLAAGASSRMQGRDKLLETVDGMPLLRTLAKRLRASGVERTLCVLRAEDTDRRAAIADLGLGVVTNAQAAEGMGTSIAVGVAALGDDVDAVLIVLGDMPEISSHHIDRLIAGFDPAEGRAIVRAVTPDGTSGHPVLFGRRFFEVLMGLAGDQGARVILREHPDFVVDIVLDGAAALADLDTPQDWAAWRRRQAASG
ncbi:MAG: molybdopterin-binding/glycosyltransferase family 2 protein [Pseudomonadota bacterium]